MTTVAQSLGGRGGGSGRSSGAPGGGSGAWKRLWQVPLLIAGLVLFGMGIRAFSRAIKPVPFEKQVEGIHAILKSGNYDNAIKQINILGDYYREKSQAMQLECLTGDTFYYAAKALGPAAPDEDWKRVGEHYTKAVRLGATPTALMNERWGEAAMALGDAQLAVEKYEAATSGEKADPAIFRAHAKELITAYLTLEKPAKAETVLDRFLTDKDLDIDDRSWSLCKKIELAMQHDKGAGSDLEKAVGVAEEAVKDMPENDPSGRVFLWIGRALFERGQIDEAKASLEAARKRFLTHHLDDGRAQVLLAKIAQIQNDLPGAESLYDEVIRSQAGTVIWAAARFGRGEIAALTGHVNEQMVGDYRYVIKALLDAAAPRAKAENLEVPSKKPELVTLDQVRTSLVAMYQRYNGQDRVDDAMEFLALQEDLKEKETPATLWRLAATREKRANQMFKEAAAIEAVGPESKKQRADKEAEARDVLQQAAEDYAKHGKLTTMDDAVSAASYWKAAQLFDEAGETTRSIELYDKFTHDRPQDPRVPEALLAIGKLYQSVGKLDQAITYYKKNIDTNPRTPAAYQSTVNLARCYMTQGPEKFSEAEGTLLKIVENNSDVDPSANEFRMSLFTLGELYYRNGKWKEAILRLQEALERYPGDREGPRAQFLLAESYRKSAMDIEAFDKTPLPLDKRDALEKARVERLMKAADLFGGVIGLLDAEAQERAGAGGGPEALTALEETMLRASYMDRAGCYFSSGDYAMAIKMYDLAATRFSQDVTAADAYVQIINSYGLLQEPAEARAAAERGWWVVKRIPEEAFAKNDGPLPLTRKYYEDFLAMRKDQGKSKAVK